MEFSTQNILVLMDNYFFELNTPKSRAKIIVDLNKTFFPDNYAIFVDHTNDKDIEFATEMSLMVEYKDNSYNILAFEIDVLPQMNRYRKLKNLNGLFWI